MIATKNLIEPVSQIRDANLFHQSFTRGKATPIIMKPLGLLIGLLTLANVTAQPNLVLASAKSSPDSPRPNQSPAELSLSEGSRAPGFKLHSQDGTPVTLKQYRGKWIVLYFYPKDFTNGCTIEAHNFERDQALYRQQNATILGVSLDTVESHKSFCAREGLNFKLLSDENSDVSREYGSLMQMGGKKYSARNTFLVDPQGVIRKIYKNVNPQQHSQEVLAALGELQAQAR